MDFAEPSGGQLDPAGFRRVPVQQQPRDYAGASRDLVWRGASVAAGRPLAANPLSRA